MPLGLCRPPLVFVAVFFCMCSCAISWRRVPSGASDAIRSRPYKDREAGLHVSLRHLMAQRFLWCAGRDKIAPLQGRGGAA